MAISKFVIGCTAAAFAISTQILPFHRPYYEPKASPTHKDSFAISVVAPGRHHHGIQENYSFSIPAKRLGSNISDEEILARFTKGFFCGGAFTPERVFLHIAPFRLTDILAIKKNIATRSQNSIPDLSVGPDIWDTSSISPKSTPPFASLLFGSFLVLDSSLVNPHRDQLPSDYTQHAKPPHAFVEIAYGGKGLGLVGSHRFEVSRHEVKQATEVEEYTTAFALFEGLWEAGITTCFVNVGSDHPSIIEAIVRGKRERPNRWPRVITCPSEVIAISMADGYARVTGRPQAVLVHVDVGTQALGQGVHNASVGRVPILIFAGLCPYTESGEFLGSRTEYMHWLQNPHDQAAIVKQFCRYTGEVRTGLNIKQTIGRALQFANSAPKGPVYLTGSREVLAQEIGQYSLQQDRWVPIGPSALPSDAVRDIAAALVQAERPLIITGYSGRDRRTPELLVALADIIPGIRVHDTGGSDMCFPFSHIASEGSRFSTHDCTKDADVILVLDCDVPYIPSRNPPPQNAKIYHVDVDPLNQQISVSFFPAHGRWKADCYTALAQLGDYIKRSSSLIASLQDKKFEARKTARAAAHQNHLADISSRLHLDDGDQLDAHNVGNLLKSILPGSTTFVVEAVTSAQALNDQLQPDRPGSWINCGGTGIGWSNGACLGVKMALEDMKHDIGSKPNLVCQIVGDGSFMCAAPSSALWVASKYKIPVLTVILNNGGWKAPRNSTELVYPEGLTTIASDDEINVSFRPTPNYAALAEAATGSEIDWDNIQDKSEAWMHGVRVRTVGEMREALKLASSRVGDEEKGMLVEVLM
ncbi:thiamine pyrophosphate enzyme, N-terminal TPP binding domain-containing protein [Xylaria bambusicola]|uniref:thiamine pyrophosphate enzyme, N-terminal TPP binding domain-containing protein n=1 Tax=Xylaria bambusicola TaxID=326684 RepID=UPI0020085B7B|nr:thiamine pyrophosphate enzyme, N-terminal TPP binding domain-containing protein [Xylaria bambusicola]KAI0528300.1 thiamine pyrophosphate enzyme, N-terminal TPP binding domain-containing protein [Xylaria bambusicola]